jgi:hypothetical protein
MPDFTLPEDSPSTACTPGTATPPNIWGSLIQTIGGDILPAYSCAAMPRDSGGHFDKEYSLYGGGQQFHPIDENFLFDFHRPVSKDGSKNCVLAPYRLPGGTTAGLSVGAPGFGDSPAGLATDFPDTAIAARTLTSDGTAGDAAWQVVKDASGDNCTFATATNGIADDGSVRFGVMMLDSDPAAGTGVTPGASPVLASGAAAFTGSFSYWYASASANWRIPAGPHRGGVPDMMGLFDYDVGARNAAAPPWEGRMVGFPPANADAPAIAANNARVKRVIQASRPYGAKPTDGLLYDARDYLWNDPAGPGATAGASGCRTNHVILVTNGSPNQDARPICAETPMDPTLPGTCPYPQLPSEVIADLASGAGGRSPTPTYVVGVGIGSSILCSTSADCGGAPCLGTGNHKFCSFPDGWPNCHARAESGNFDAMCAAVAGQPPTATGAGQCCELERFARAGKPAGDTCPNAERKTCAYFVDDGNVKGALQTILARIPH